MRVDSGFSIELKEENTEIPSTPHINGREVQYVQPSSQKCCNQITPRHMQVATAIVLIASIITTVTGATCCNEPNYLVVEIGIGGCLGALGGLVMLCTDAICRRC